jgi:hypothetical protein
VRQPAHANWTIGRRFLDAYLQYFLPMIVFGPGLASRLGLNQETHVREMKQSTPKHPRLVIRQTWITREDLQANRDIVFVFGDNAAHEGQRGLARQMRNECNSHSISIAWGAHEPFSLGTSEAAIVRMEEDFSALSRRHSGTIVWPLTGIVPEFQSMPEELRAHLRRLARTTLGLSDPV